MQYNFVLRLYEICRGKMHLDGSSWKVIAIYGVEGVDRVPDQRIDAPFIFAHARIGRLIHGTANLCLSFPSLIHAMVVVGFRIRFYFRRCKLARARASNEFSIPAPIRAPTTVRRCRCRCSLSFALQERSSSLSRANRALIYPRLLHYSIASLAEFFIKNAWQAVP